MARTLEEVRDMAMELSRNERAQLSEELALSVWAPGVLDSWVAESERRLDAIRRGEERVLTAEEFWRDE